MSKTLYLLFFSLLPLFSLGQDIPNVSIEIEGSKGSIYRGDENWVRVWVYYIPKVQEDPYFRPAFRTISKDSVHIKCSGGEVDTVVTRSGNSALFAKIIPGNGKRLVVSVAITQKDGSSLMVGQKSSYILNPEIPQIIFPGESWSTTQLKRSKMERLFGGSDSLQMRLKDRNLRHQFEVVSYELSIFDERAGNGRLKTFKVDGAYLKQEVVEALVKARPGSRILISDLKYSLQGQNRLLGKLSTNYVVVL